MLYTNNPDMIAFTLGRVILRLARAGTPIGADTITQALIRIAGGDSTGRVSPEMAKSALAALRRLDIEDHMTPATLGRDRRPAAAQSWLAS